MWKILEVFLLPENNKNDKEVVKEAWEVKGDKKLREIKWSQKKNRKEWYEICL